MKFQRMKDMICGALIASMVLCYGTVAFAKVANINIPVSFSNIKIVVDGEQISTSKEPFTYEGTTYLPVRAVAEAVGKDVTWDGNTKTVYLGEAPKNISAPKTADGKNNDIEVTGATLTYEYGMPKLYLDFKNDTYWNLFSNGVSIVQFGIYKYKTADGKIVEIPENEVHWLEVKYKG